MTLTADITALDLLSQLGRETITSYTASGETVSTIVTELLALQVLTPAVTAGTIDAAIGNLTRDCQVDGGSILSALLSLRETTGGYIEVDNDRELNWTVAVGEDKGQQIRYGKNLAGIRRSIDYTSLANRIYAYGSGEGDARVELAAPGYVEDIPSQGTWGGIYVKVIKSNKWTAVATLTAWANQMLDLYSDPLIEYDVDIANLALSDSFSFDALQLGSIVTVIDEDLGIDVSVRVVRIEYTDLLNPETMRLKLSTRMNDISDLLAEVYEQQQAAQMVTSQIDASQVVSGNLATTRLSYNAANAVNAGAVVINADRISLTGKTLDDIGDGTIYQRVLATQISAGKINLSSNCTYAAGYNPSTKRRVFTATPTTPYDIGDLWLDASTLKRCTTARASGAYQSGDWTATTLDAISDGSTYSRVKTTQISAGEIVLTDTGMIIDKTGVRTAESGTRLEIKATGIRGYNGATLQVELSATDGKLYALAGNFVAEASRVAFFNGVALKFYSDSGTTENGRIYCGAGEMLLYNPNGDVSVVAGAGAEVNLSTSVPDAGAGAGSMGTTTTYWGLMTALKLKLKETTTPTATSGFGAIYTKTDNVLYFQDGDGVEHALAFVP